MTFLQGLLAKIAEWFLEFIWRKITDYVKSREAQKAADKEIEEKNKAIREGSEKAETPEEREDSAGKVFDGFDGP